MTKQHLKFFLNFLQNLAKEYLRILCSRKQGFIFNVMCKVCREMQLQLEICFCAHLNLFMDTKTML